MSLNPFFLLFSAFTPPPMTFASPFSPHTTSSEYVLYPSIFNTPYIFLSQLFHVSCIDPSITSLTLKCCTYKKKKKNPPADNSVTHNSTNTHRFYGQETVLGPTHIRAMWWRRSTVTNGSENAGNLVEWRTSTQCHPSALGPVNESSINSWGDTQKGEVFSKHSETRSICDTARAQQYFLQISPQDLCYFTLTTTLEPSTGKPELTLWQVILLHITARAHAQRHTQIHSQTTWYMCTSALSLCYRTGKIPQ